MIIPANISWVSQLIRGDHFKIGQIIPYNMTYQDYKQGKFYPQNQTGNFSAEQLFEESYDDNYYLLDITGLKYATMIS